MDTKVGESKREAVRRRQWPEAMKRQMVAETLEPGASVSLVARRHDVNANLLFNWRRQQQTGTLPVRTTMVPVRIEGPGRKAHRPAAEPARTAGGMVEIELKGGIKVRIHGRVDGATLQQVLAVLARP